MRTDSLLHGKKFLEMKKLNNMNSLEANPVLEVLPRA
jgi:hypothetical protein